MALAFTHCKPHSLTIHSCGFQFHVLDERDDVISVFHGHSPWLWLCLNALNYLNWRINFIGTSSVLSSRCWCLIVHMLFTSQKIFI
ncbi:hypothetical protein O6P43_027372 [Quillaja saponaria]|uniref:Uncharacterized protein n=1 Tax=Quillaja saponaria TaxID=32244 RepID=A0AAD7PDV6_QUISA|nr:hypothetical protein O6P43_027372 [Quillaja saponaria]